MPHYVDWNDWLLNRPTEKTRIWCRTLPEIDEMTGKTGPSDIFFVILMMDGYLLSAKNHRKGGGYVVLILLMAGQSFHQFLR